MVVVLPVCVLLALTLIVVANLTVPGDNSKQINALPLWRHMTIVLLSFLQRKYINQSLTLLLNIQPNRYFER
ncbi:hypothetical protein BGX38DRAFT_696493 [Terfezia claveryi]|nr:hypothetical protein BGX38DRAFT_696493 [Terfezia claveryi]